MDKMHFYQRLTRWQHLRFNDVVLRERPDTQAWNKKYEIYIQDKTKLSAQLYIRTTQPGEDVTLVMAEYLSWLEDYNDDESVVTAAQESAPASLNKLKESCRPRSGTHQPRIHTPTPAARYTRSLS
ncbi:hypothetical protein Q3V30_16725 [Erwinia pyri]|uniref:Uncharacterized protein n=1 Tax=Erwinia pyri TaxID=3062598 RepID=A0AA50HPJ3_9GAMM|nr:hypothetical protein [Erwinia sp. DE2]WLS78095.1 hypothetical protein Q3V30_16725 [Erwinia sp. DE2]